MWVLLGLILGGHGAASFVLHLASSCPLGRDGSVVGLELAVVFNKVPLVCSDPRGQGLAPCAPGGPLDPLAARVAAGLSNDSAWRQRALQRHRACRDMAPRYRGVTELRSAPPQIQLVPTPTGDAHVLLTCHAWGFHPATLTLLWLCNGDVVDSPSPTPTPRGDGTYQTRVTLEVAPGPGDTFTCWVQHPSLEQPLVEEWSPGTSPSVTLQVAVATVALALGLGTFVGGARRWVGPRTRGYTEIPGDTHGPGTTRGLPGL